MLGLETLGLITFQQGWIFVLSNTNVWLSIKMAVK